MAKIVGFAAVVGEEIHRSVWRDEFGVLGYELCDPRAVRNERLKEDGWICVPPTVDQSVSIVRENSYNEIVNPRMNLEQKVGKGEIGVGTDHIFSYFLA